MSPEQTLRTKWIPVLLDVWRRRLRNGSTSSRAHQARSPHRLLPTDRLTPDELTAVAGQVKLLSHGLTRERELAGSPYLDDANQLGAYLLFYWPISYLQGRAVLAELEASQRRVGQIGPSESVELGDILDLGAGPAPLAFAALDAGARKAIACDRSKKALEVARDLATAVGATLETRPWDPVGGGLGRTLVDAVGRTPRFDCMTAGHLLNELWKGDDAVTQRTRLVEQMRLLLKPQGSLLLIEPALRETSRGLLEIRDRLVDGGAAIRAPCFYRGHCPGAYP